MDHNKVRNAVKEKRIDWRKHVLERLAERGIKQKTILDVLSNGEIIEEYPDDYPFPNALYFSVKENTPFHVVASFDEHTNSVYIITAYIPSTEIFGQDYRTRRKK
jgi:hypothetical protein